MGVELHPELSAEERRRLVLEGLELFNSGRFYDCHEAWETVWRSTTPEPADLFRGLIQVAVGFFHLHSRRRPDVAHRVLGKGLRRVEPFAPRTLGLDLAELVAEVETWRRVLAAHRASRVLALLDGESPEEGEADLPPRPRLRIAADGELH